MFIFRRSLNNEVYYVRSEDNLYISSTIFVIICDISNGIPSLRVLTSSIGNTRYMRYMRREGTVSRVVYHETRTL